MSPPHKKKRDGGQEEVNELIDMVIEKVTSLKNDKIVVKQMEVEIEPSKTESYEEK